MCQNIIPKVLSTTDEEMYREEGVLNRFLMYVLVPRVFCTRGENIIFEGVLTPALGLGWNQYGGLAGLVCGTQNTSKNSRIG